MRTETCHICYAQVKAYENYREHLNWHARLERAIYNIPEPPPLRKSL